MLLIVILLLFLLEVALRFISMGVNISSFVTNKVSKIKKSETTLGKVYNLGIKITKFSLKLSILIISITRKILISSLIPVVTTEIIIFLLMIVTAGSVSVM